MRNSVTWRDTRSRSLGAVLPFLLAAASGYAANLALPPDGTMPAPASSSDPSDFVVFTDFVLFSADDGIHGRELWISKAEFAPDTGAYGTKMLMDIVPGPESSDPRHLVSVESFGGVFFSAWTAETGRELWVAYGNERGFDVKLVKDLEPGPVGSNPVPINSLSRRSLFYATTAKNGREPWVSDGSPDGTALLKDIMPGDAGSQPSGLLSCRAGQRVFFAAVDSLDTGIGLWSTNGTSAGTVRVADVDDNTKYMKAIGDKVVFAQQDTEHGFEAWISDGTAAGTRLLMDISPGAESSNPSQLSECQGRVYFQALSPGLGAELWCTDGTEAGTQLLKEINPGQAGSDAYGFASAGGNLYFHAVDDAFGRELWKTDGTREGTIMVKDINPGPRGSNPYALCAVGDTLLFSADDGEHGEELWTSDGTSNNTSMALDIYPGPASSEPYATIAAGTVSEKTIHGFFSATDPIHGRELWWYGLVYRRSLQTSLRKDINQSSAINPSSSPHDLVSVGNRLFFSVNDIAHGEELWVLDQYFEFMRLVRDIFPGTASSSPAELTKVGDLLYFRANDGVNGDELWRSDGTPQGTILVQDLNTGPQGSSPKNLYCANGLLYFSAATPALGEELYAVNGPTDGIRLAADIRRGPASSCPRNFTSWIDERGQEYVFFAADDGVHGEELWTVTPSKEVRMVLDIAAMPLKGASLQYLTPRPEGLYFVASDAIHPGSIWISDGTVGGTRHTNRPTLEPVLKSP